MMGQSWQDRAGRTGLAGQGGWEPWCHGQQLRTEPSFVLLPGNLEHNPICGSSKKLIFFFCVSEEQQDENTVLCF